MKALLIAEKPDLMKQIQAVYKKNSYSYEIDFACFAGHVIRQKEPREYDNPLWQQKKWSYDMLPIIPNPFEYTVIEEKKRIFNDVKKQLNSTNYDFVINACDAEREGNHIFQLFYNYVNCKLPIKRFWTNDLMDSSIDYALKNLRFEGDGLKPNLKTLTEAAFLRAQFDFMVGMNFTIAVTLALNSAIIARIGRVKSATLSILGKREEELANFKSKTTYGLDVLYKEGFSGTFFDSNGEVIKDRKNEFDDVIKKLGKTATVESVEKKREKAYAPKLFNMTALQHEAGNTYGYDAEETLNITQSLYEKKLVTYPRSDCPYVSTELTKKFPMMLKAVATHPDFKDYVDNIKPEDNKRACTSSDYINDKELAKAGHSAIVPTGQTPNWSSLSQNEKNILYIICKRFLAIFLPPTISDKTTVVTNNNGYKFKTNGKIVVDKGYAILYDTNFKDVALPPLNNGDTVNVDKFDVKEKVTKPPKRYTDAELVIVMEKPGNFLDDENLKEILKDKKGIGRESTRAAIITELEKNGYIEKKKGKGKAKTIFVTEQGMFLYKNIKNSDFAKVDMTAIWETKLSEVENEDISASDFKEEMLNYVLSNIDKIKNETVVVGSYKKDGGNNILGPCPKCKNGNVLILPTFYCCEHRKKEGGTCDFAFSKEIFGAKVSENEARKIINGQTTKEFAMKKDDKTWNAALCYSQESGKVEFAQRNVDIGKCPCCGGTVKETAKYYMCNEYKPENENPNACHFIISKDYFGAKITTSDVEKILNGEKTRTLKMKKGDKQWETQLMYLPDEKKVGFAPREEHEFPPCPCCGSAFKETAKYFMCSKYPDNCKIIISKDYFGAKITTSDVEKILNGEKTRTLKMKKGDKQWETQLMYLPNEKKVGFAPREVVEQKDIGKCPCCGGAIKITPKYYMCENYKNPCNFIFSKEMYGAKISESEAKKILSGKETKEFSMSNGSKNWNAKLVYNPTTQRVEFAAKDNKN